MKLIRRPRPFTDRGTHVQRGSYAHEWRGHYVHPGPDGQACIHTAVAHHRVNARRNARRVAIREHGEDGI